MSKEDDSFIKATDFNRILLNIALMNLTTKAEIRNGKRSFGVGMEKSSAETEVEHFEVRIFQFLDDGFLLEVPSKTCAINHAISLEIVSENASPNIKFSANLKVISVEKISSSIELVHAKLTQKSVQEWNDLQSLFGNRQNEINQFLKEVKGLESDE